MNTPIRSSWHPWRASFRTSSHLGSTQLKTIESKDEKPWQNQRVGVKLSLVPAPRQKPQLNTTQICLAPSSAKRFMTKPATGITIASLSMPTRTGATATTTTVVASVGIPKPNGKTTPEVERAPAIPPTDKQYNTQAMAQPRRTWIQHCRRLMVLQQPVPLCTALISSSRSSATSQQTNLGSTPDPWTLKQISARVRIPFTVFPQKWLATRTIAYVCHRRTPLSWIKQYTGAITEQTSHRRDSISPDACAIVSVSAPATQQGSCGTELLTIERLYPIRAFQNGGSADLATYGPSIGVDSEVHSPGCILTYPATFGRPSFCGILLATEDLSSTSPDVWSGPCAPVVYKN
ncbi:hypothetical protein BDB00DRAFT_930553 [Zychaea mexicana]|uniref:uncharacterized protein n=1 Tax=Zychaea mexicana TaxID=64656 RepID=UPI0022FF0AB8|nr:uncharacterized protein BDB00DRAFT_930553 [Zychaea mexicana]KAI9491245.1 hypothetical protein BDB00DRAFT_930553 [Zychaea mexicana]